MGFRFLLDSLLLYDPDRSSSVTNVWVGRPTPNEEQALGKLFVISSITTPSRVNHEIISIVQDELKSNFYQTSEERLGIAFEQALLKTNQRVHSLIVEGIAEWVDHAHFLVGVLRQDTLFIATVGSMYAFVLRNGRLYDILGADASSKVNPLRIFGSSSSGQLQPKDQLIFCTPSLLDYFSLEKIRRTMIDHTPSEAIRTLESSLLGTEYHVSFGALIIQLHEIEETIPTVSSVGPMPAPARPTAPQVSMEELIAREKATQKLLSPSMWPAITDIFQRLGQGADQLIREKIFRRPPRRSIPAGVRAERISSPRRPLVRFHLGQWPKRWRLAFASIGRKARAMPRPHLGQVAQNMPAAPTLPRRSRRPLPSLGAIISRFQRLPRQQQLIAGGACIITLLFIISLASKGTGQKTTTQTAGVSSLTTVATDISKAQAALLYGGEDTARQLYTEATALLATVNAKSKTDKTSVTAFRTQLAAIAQQLSHVTIIGNPTIIADVKTAAVPSSPQQLFVQKNGFLAYDSTKKIATIINASSGLMSPLANTLDTGSPVVGATLDATNVIFATDRATFVQLDTATKTWKPLDAKFAYTNPQFTSMATFQNRLYILDAKDNDIQRFVVGKNSLGTSSTWLKQPATLQAASGLAVDGSIYVAHPNGLIDMYATGKKTTFTLATVTPALTHANRLWTDAATTRLYIIDSPAHRVLAFDKKGALLDQYTSPNWTALRDVVVNEKTKTAYVLNGSAIESFTLKH